MPNITVNGGPDTLSASGHGSFELFPISSSVGGVAVPVGKFGLLGPYICLVSTLTVVAVATAVCVRRVKRGKEKL
jgi:hypothetical protein